MAHISRGVGNLSCRLPCIRGYASASALALQSDSELYVHVALCMQRYFLVLEVGVFTTCQDIRIANNVTLCILLEVTHASMC